MKIVLCTLTFLLGLVMVSFAGRSRSELIESIPATAADTPIKISMDVKMVAYGTTEAGIAVDEFTCTNENGVVMKMITYGATMTSLEIPDKNNQMANVVLTAPDLKGFLGCTSYFGATVGRYCNRIAEGRFSLDDKEYTLATNNAPNHLHGGDVGFDNVVWSAEPITGNGQVGVRFTYESADMEEGYPGKLNVVAEYILNNDNQVVIDLKATTDKPTHLNLTNHNYWNLAGAGEGLILKHQLKVEAEKFLPANDTLIPTGELSNVKETLFDFTEFRAMGDRLDEVGENPAGFDLCFALRKQDGSLNLAATVKEPESGRTMEVWTTQPGLQFYTGNFLDGSEGSCGYSQYGGFCLETQHYPDSPNQPKFPSTLLKPGEKFHQKTLLKFDVDKD